MEELLHNDVWLEGKGEWCQKSLNSKLYICFIASNIKQNMIIIDSLVDSRMTKIWNRIAWGS